MKLTESMVRRAFGSEDHKKGMKYVRAGRVKNLQLIHQEDAMEVICQVQGTDLYRVWLRVDAAGVQGVCSCPRFQACYTCKHLAAAAILSAELLEQEEQEEQEEQGRKALAEPELLPQPARPTGPASDRTVRALLESCLAPELPPQGRLARLEVTLNESMGYPGLSLRVGMERMYRIRDIDAFLSRMEQGETYSYGAKLTLCHRLEQFDSFSQELILLLQDRNDALRRRYGAAAKSEIMLTGGDFDQLFQLLMADPEQDLHLQPPMQLSEGVPPVALQLEQPQGEEQTARLTVKKKQKLLFWGSHRALYVWVMGAEGQKDRAAKALIRCSPEFRERVYPLLRKPRWTLAAADIPTFVSVAVPQLQGLVQVQVPQELQQAYRPDACTPRFYFDMQVNAGTPWLRARLRLSYPGGEADPQQPVGQTPGIKRDLLAERRAAYFLEQYFAPRSDFPDRWLEGDDSVYRFLTQELPLFQAQGEVFLSEGLTKQRITAPRAGVGLSVSDGQLLLELDTGDFPPEELEALYQSLVQRRKYHRLKNGRYLTLDGSGFETLAEAAHMLRLTPKQLKTGKLTLPAYRAPYLEELLEENDRVEVRRDEGVRALIDGLHRATEEDWPLPAALQGALRPYQQVGYRWMKALEHCGFGGILADEMGLGKTLQAIAFLCSATRADTGLPSLVVCPTSLILNWGAELERFAPSLQVMLVLGNAEQRRDQLEHCGQADLLVTSYELLRKDAARYAELDFYCCILDEGQYVKNSATLTSRAVKRLHCRQRFVLTGTPIENRLSELWNLFDFLMPGYLYSAAAFREQLEKPILKDQDAQAARQLQRLVQPFLLRRLKQDVLRELPPKIEHLRPVALTREERKVYAACSLALRRQLEQEQGGKLQVLSALTRLRQICCDPSLCFDNYHGPASKLEACLELCASMVENGHQILLFSQFTTMLERLKQRLDDLGISNLTLRGSTGKAQRAQRIERFNAGEASVFLISLKAGGTGLNLTAADVVIHYDPWWNLAAQQQATDRAHRMGQQAHVQVYKLIAKDTIEERILQMQGKKAALMQAFGAGSDQGILSLSKQELLELLEGI